jgi:hypothetical protein
MFLAGRKEYRPRIIWSEVPKENPRCISQQPAPCFNVEQHQSSHSDRLLALPEFKTNGCHSGESRNPLTRRPKSLDPGFRRDDKRIELAFRQGRVRRIDWRESEVSADQALRKYPRWRHDCHLHVTRHRISGSAPISRILLRHLRAMTVIPLRPHVAVRLLHPTRRLRGTHINACLFGFAPGRDCPFHPD